jgi:hypothetical protein
MYLKINYPKTYNYHSYSIGIKILSSKGTSNAKTDGLNWR